MMNSVIIKSGMGLVASLMASTTFAVTAPKPIPGCQGTHVDPKGNRIEVTTKSLVFNGKPTIGVMGEMHYSRVPRNEWRDYLTKMKAGGVTVAASYVFWAHHEPIEGVFDFSGCRDLRDFLEAAEAIGLPVVLRIGPWVHGECSEGGFPDWLVTKFNADKKRLRTTGAAYLACVDRFWKRLFVEVKGHLFKDGGCVIGVQLENESTGPWPYIMALKKMAIGAGFDVPFYTRTGWPEMKGDIEYGQVLPLFGGYADGFWWNKPIICPDHHKRNFYFTSVRSSSAIANEHFSDDQLGKDERLIARYPYLTCELGGGMPSSYSRRILTSPMDAISLAIVRLGCGSNLLGYYMYAGGTNPNHPEKGEFYNESRRARFTFHNDLPPFSYEFNAPISEFGELAPHYWVLKELHEFCAKYGEELALLDPVIVSDTESRRGRFVFHNDYVRWHRANGDCWIAIDRDGKLEKLLVGSSLVAKYAQYGTGAAIKGERVSFRQLKPAGDFVPPRKPSGLILQPNESDWALAAEWTIEPPAGADMLALDYSGDCARLYVDGVPVADDFYKGRPMKVALRRYPKGKLTFKVLPWTGVKDVYFQPGLEPKALGASLRAVISYR